MVVAVAALLGGPAEDIEGEVRVRLRPDGSVYLRRAESWLEDLDPVLELLRKGCLAWVGSRSRKRRKRWGR